MSQITISETSVCSITTPTATVAELLKLAQEIQQRIQSSNIAWYDEKGNNDLLNWLQSKYHNFAISFPFVLRWQVQMREYHPKAFAQFLMSSSKNPPKSRKEFLDNQAEYLVLLQHFLYKKSGKQLKKEREIIRQQLYNEDQEFTNEAKISNA